MGNKLTPPERKRGNSRVFTSPTDSLASLSLTIPSVCTSPSYHLSMKKSTSISTNDSFNWQQMQNVYTKQQFLNIDTLTVPQLRVTTTVFEVLKRVLGEICEELDSGSLKFPEATIDRFIIHAGGKAAYTQASLQSLSSAVIVSTKKMIVHFVTMLFLHDLILNHFRLGETETALDIIKQIAVSHALKGVTETEFRMMDWFIIHYLIKTKATNDDNINSLILYLNTFSNYISESYKSQSVRHYMMKTLTKEKEDDRSNKARENYRLMKKWKKLIESFKDQESYVDKLLAGQKEAKKMKDADSIDTLTLKQNDCIMKHLAKKPPKQKKSDKTDID